MSHAGAQTASRSGKVDRQLTASATPKMMHQRLTTT
jgi:hypothetical protein